MKEKADFNWSSSSYSCYIVYTEFATDRGAAQITMMPVKRAKALKISSGMHKIPAKDFRHMPRFKWDF